LIIEVDWSIHQKEDIAEHNQIKSDVLKGFGYKIVRLTNDEVLNNTNLVLKNIKTEIYSPPSYGGTAGSFLKNSV